MDSLKKIFKKRDIVFVYLFGSRAENRETANSDYDFAVFLKEHSLEKRFSLRLKLIQKAGEKLKAPVDVIVLNDTRSLSIRYEVVMRGKLLYETDPSARIDFELKTMREYEEFAPFLKAYNEAYLSSV